MKAILEFDLSEGEKLDLEMAVRAPEMAAALGEILEYLRSIIKYEDGGDEYLDIRNKVIDILQERGIDVDAL